MKDVPWTPGQAIVILGFSLELATAGLLKASPHMVVAPQVTSAYRCKPTPMSVWIVIFESCFTHELMAIVVASQVTVHQFIG